MASREGSGAAVRGSDFGRAVVNEQRNILGKALHKIEHCLSQLTDGDMSWRPRPEMNSIAIVVNHLCGNVRQWIICGLTGAPDHRDRPGEFVDPGPVTVGAVRSKVAQRSPKRMECSCDSILRICCMCDESRALMFPGCMR
jgi:hypothetical protein